MTEPTALIDTAAEFTEDAWGTPEDEQMWPEDFYSADWADDDPNPYAGTYSEGGDYFETDIAWDCDGAW